MSDDDPTTAPHEDKPRHRYRWLQFRLRTALYLLLLVALALGWWRDRQQLNDRLERSKLLREAVRLAQPSPRDVFWGDALLVEQWIRAGETTIEPLPQFLTAYQSAFGWNHVDEALRPKDGRPEEKQQAVQQLVALLGEGDAETRARAACTLGFIGPDAAPAAPALRRALHDEERSVRWHAVFALATIGPDPASSAALRALMRDDRAGMPAYAAQQLRKIEPGADVVPRLRELLKHPQPETRRRAVEELSAIDNDAARAAWRALLPLLADADTAVRRTALSAVRKLAPREAALDALTTAFKSETDNDLKRHAAVMLTELDAEQ